MRCVVRIVIADPQPIFVRGLLGLLSEHSDISVVASCGAPLAVLTAVKQHTPDIVILDPSLDPIDPFGVVRALARTPKPPRVILLTATVSVDEVCEAVRLGVSGVLVKSMSPTLVVQCIRKVALGERWIEKESAGRAVESLLRREASFQETTHLLTSREMEVLRVASSGSSNRHIAEQLCISEGTVKMHLRSIYEKLDLHGRSQLIIYARENRLVDEQMTTR
jgi:DNA-binding NarL/FixJ family response regulator